MYKSAEFMKKLKYVGENVQVFEHALLLKPEVISLHDGVRIDDFVKIEGGTGVTIGAHTHIASFVGFAGGGTTTIGRYVALAQGVRIISGKGHPFWEHFPIAPPEDDFYHLARQEVTIEDYGGVAANAVVVPGVTIHEGGVVAAGAVAMHDVPPWTLVAGVPAKPVRERRNFTLALK